MAQKRHSSEPAFLRAASAAEEPAPEGPAPPPAGLRVAAAIVRYALAGLLGYLGALKLSPAAAQMIQPLVENSPLLSWLYRYLTVEDAARVIGAVEAATALLLLASPIAAWLALLGSLLAAVTFATTFSFLFTTPGTFVALAGAPLPAPSALAVFLVKDAFLFAAAVWSASVAIRALRRA